ATAGVHRVAELRHCVADGRDAAQAGNGDASHVLVIQCEALQSANYAVAASGEAGARSRSTPRTTSPTVLSELRLSSGISMENISSTAKVRLILSSESICNSSKVVSRFTAATGKFFDCATNSITRDAMSSMHLSPEPSREATHRLFQARGKAMIKAVGLLYHGFSFSGCGRAHRRRGDCRGTPAKAPSEWPAPAEADDRAARRRP